MNNKTITTITSTSGTDVTQWTIDNTPTITVPATSTTSPYVNIYHTSRYGVMIEELKPSSKFEKDQLVKLLWSNTVIDNNQYGVIHEAYNDFCIVIFDFKFYKVDSSYLVDAFDK